MGEPPTGAPLGERVRRQNRPALPRHVWVDDAPGLLVEWSRADDGQWWGRTVLAPGGVPEISWVRAEQLRPR